MYKLIRYYNQNRKKIWIYVLIVIFCFTILKVIDYKIKSEKNPLNNSLKEVNYASSNNSIKEVEKYSAISQKSVSTQKNEKIKKLIDDFLNYCNNKDIEAAYNMLSYSCQSELFPNIQQFKDNYYNRIFTQKIIYSMQSWIVNNNCYTYQVKFMPDILAIGESNNSEVIYDYITIVNEDIGEADGKSESVLKLNINNYIGREEINKISTMYDIEINILYKDIYMDYETYKIRVKNKTDNTILLDTKNNIDTVYLLGKEDLKYIGYMHEIDLRNIIIGSNGLKELSIKFDKDYNPKREIKSMNFTDVILDYNEQLNKEGIEAKAINISI